MSKELCQPGIGRQDKIGEKKAEMTRSILIITFLYIILSLPDTIISAFFSKTFEQIEIGYLMFDLVNILHSSYPAFNFFILFFSNKVFNQEVRVLLGHLLKRNKVSLSDNVKTSASIL